MNRSVAALNHVVKRAFHSSQVQRANAAVRLSPAARHMMESRSLDVSKVQGTSKGGLISKADLVKAINSGIAKKIDVPAAAPVVAAAPVPSAPAVVIPPSVVAPTYDFTALINSSAPVNDKFKDIPVTNMRKVIAKRLTESKATVPHMYSSIDIEIDELLNLRKYLKKEFDVNVSVNDVVIKCAALALRDVPEVNGKWDRNNNTRVLGSTVDISVAVATPTGLITPIVTKADKRGVSEISNVVRDLATRARDGKLKPEEYQGGSFSISNLGMFGISSFSAVINPPQACILAVGSGINRIAPPSTPGGSPRAVTVMTVQLSGDRRVVDEATASQFLQVFKSYISNPASMML